MSTTLRAKDPQEVVDYPLSWADRLGADTISASTWTIVSGTGLVIDSNTFNATSATVWLSAGIVGQLYQLLNHITTAGGRQFDQTCWLEIIQK